MGGTFQLSSYFLTDVPFVNLTDNRTPVDNDSDIMTQVSKDVKILLSLEDVTQNFCGNCGKGS